MSHMATDDDDEDEDDDDDSMMMMMMANGFWVLLETFNTTAHRLTS